MQNEEGFKIGGKELAKVLIYYGFIQDTSSLEQKIVCPFHQDINPSMKVDLSEGSFYCFGCGLSGDALKFVMLMNEGLDDLKACIKFIKILNSKKVCKVVLTGRKKKRVGNTQYLLEAKDYYYGLNKTDWNNLDDAGKEVFEYFKNRGYSANALNKCKAKISYNNSYPILFPMLDNGVFKGWVSRTTSERVTKVRKYLYNDGFSKSDTLVGNYKDTKTILVCEGYLDWLKLRMFGYKNVVALLGWHASEEQISKLKAKGVEIIVSALDMDECGNKGTERLRKFFTVVRFQYLDGVKDAGDLSKESFEKCRKATIKEYNKIIKEKVRGNK